MECGDIEIRTLDLLPIGRPFDDALIINAVQTMCC
jgi:hypothetical protein